MTLHSTHNFGAVLQAFALQTKLNELGYSSEIINYSTLRSEESKHLFKTKISAEAFVQNLRTLSDYKARKARYLKFEEFINREMKLSAKKYRTPEDLAKESFDYDVFLTGSDQTFNLYLGGEKQDRYAYYLPFVENKKKLSYASSFGEKLSFFNEQDIEFVKNMMSKFSAVSLREQSGVDFLKNKTGIEAETVLDPTMLLSKDAWGNIINDTSVLEGEYILYYSVLADSWSVEQARKLSEATHLPIVAPHLKNRYELKANFIRINDIGPKEFVGLIKNAKFICTTSFHCTIFSLLFNRPFYALEFGEGARLKTLLSKLNLLDRIIKHNENADVERMNTIDYYDVNRLIDDEREKSVEFLRRHIH